MEISRNVEIIENLYHRYQLTQSRFLKQLLTYINNPRYNNDFRVVILGGRMYVEFQNSYVMSADRVCDIIEEKGTITIEDFMHCARK